MMAPDAFAHFANPQGIVFARGGLVVADSGNHLIRFVTLNGTVSTLAGSTAGFADGAGHGRPVQLARRLAADAAGNIYVADLLNNRVRKIDPANNVTTRRFGLLPAERGHHRQDQEPDLCGGYGHAFHPA